MEYTQTHGRRTQKDGAKPMMWSSQITLLASTIGVMGRFCPRIGVAPKFYLGRDSAVEVVAAPRPASSPEGCACHMAPDQTDYNHSANQASQECASSRVPAPHVGVCGPRIQHCQVAMPQCPHNVQRKVESTSFSFSRRENSKTYKCIYPGCRSASKCSRAVNEPSRTTSQQSSRGTRCSRQRKTWNDTRFAGSRA